MRKRRTARVDDAGSPALDIRAPARLSTKRRHLFLNSTYLFAIGIFASGQFMAFAAAQAQGCNSTSRPPPSPPVNMNFTNQTFTPTTGYFIGSTAANGCAGAAGNTSIFSPSSGQPGSDGQGSGAISTVNTGLRVLGGYAGAPLQPTTAAPITSLGGRGGDGGQAGYAGTQTIVGGNGGNAGTGGNVTVRFDAQLTPFNGQAADSGLSVSSFGGYGGSGGDAYRDGIYSRNAGDAGNGAAAGVVAIQATGSYQVNISAVLASSVGGNGGQGGNVPSTTDVFDILYGGQGGNAGAGSAASIRFSGAVTSNLYGLQAMSIGGSGGDGGSVTRSTSTKSGSGGTGAAGGTAAVTLGGGTIAVVRPFPSSGTLTVGIEVGSTGGQGGNGGQIAPSGGAVGGSGGGGGDGGPATATVLSDITLTVAGSAATDPLSGYGVFVQSSGGNGGAGTGVNSIIGVPGGGGFAGSAGSAGLTLGDASHTGTIRTNGNFAAGALVQSVGGGGGGGGNASFTFGGGFAGAGAAGGNGGPVTVDAPNASVITIGTNSMALLAQSIGGGGGNGGDAMDIPVGAGIAVGGNGGLGGNGGSVTVNLGGGVFASTNTLGGGGLLAQSIGGSGGTAGSASTSAIGVISFAIGGDAGNGGMAGPVSISNGGLVTTYGDHAVGLLGQSIGGGGGRGGAAVSFTGGAVPTASVSIGGRGGSGGPGGNVTVSNGGQVVTYGADAYGVLLQSVGGGGGAGGVAAARAVSLSPSKYVPAVSISVALGGSGGNGNLGGTVQLGNTGLITTAGDGAIAVVAQSIGGGGGTGGDATAASYSNGPQAGVSISVATAVGGSGGSGGQGGAVTLTNGGVIATLGQDAYGVFAQSVGGGGGIGGGGDASASSGDSKMSFAASVAVGGTGGSGGDGGKVGLTNTGSIVTRGDGADAVFAQSVGGGGGVGAGGVAKAGAGNLSVAVGVGGRGGAGGDGGAATAQNGGSIVTRGTDSIGLSVQSVGGGGGKGGKGGATAGGASPVSSATSLFDILKAGLNFGQAVTDLGDGILQIGKIGEEITATEMQLMGIFQQPQAGAAKDGKSMTVNIAVSVGGSGGAAGAGGVVSATNTGSITTFGAQSDGIYAQSIGAGGGSGGAASSTDGAKTDKPKQFSVAVGGSGGGGGNGGAVTVTNGTGATISTQGVAAFGILAQSVGGGGGEGSMAGTVDGSLKSLGVSLGGSGGAGANGGDVTVTNAGTLNTLGGKHGLGILAQSIGGGGGLARTMTTDETFDPSKLLSNPQGRLGDIHGISLDLGGRDNAGGSGGQVQVILSGHITTGGTDQQGSFGLDSYGIVAQSIGGGGGAAIGGQLNAAPASSSHSVSGDGGPVTVSLTAGAVLATRGDGAYGIIAQSIGGGGGLAGDPSRIATYVQDIPASIQRPGNGNGGDVRLTLTNGSVQTTGAYAPAIFAQSVGGGGGLLSVAVPGQSGQTLYRGSAHGTGTGGGVTVSLTGASVLASGVGSAGILAQSTGSTTGAILISIDKASTVTGGTADPNAGGQDPAQRDAAAIRLLGGTGNQIMNQGAILANGGGLAILADAAVAISGSGRIEGDVKTGTSGSLDILPGGSLSGRLIDVGGGTVRNAGTLQVGGAGTVGTTTIVGNFVQTAAGTLVVDLAAGPNVADRLQVNGTADIAGTIRPVIADARNLRPGVRETPLVSATGGIVQRSGAVLVSTPVVRFDLASPDVYTVNLRYNVDYGGAAALATEGLASSNRSEVGRALNAVFSADGGALAPFAARLAGLPSARLLTATLDSLSGEATADVQQAVFTMQQAYTGAIAHHARENGCAPDMATGVGCPLSNAQGLSVWFSGFGGTDLLTGTDSRGDLHTQTAGGMLGLEKWFDAGHMAGVAVGGGTTDFSVSGRASDGHSNSVNIGLYGLTRFGRAYVTGVVSYGYFGTDLRRAAIPAPTLLATMGSNSVGSNAVGGRVEGGWTQPLGIVDLTPFAAFEVDHVWQGATTETTSSGDGGLALRYAGKQQTSLPLTLGARVGRSFRLPGERVLDVSAELGWVHEFDPTRSVTASFLGAPSVSFRILGTSASRDAALAALDAKLALSRNVAVLGRFSGRFSGVETAVGGFGGLQVTW